MNKVDIMSLFIGFVPLAVSVDDLANAFTETFGSTVMVRFSKDKVNKNGVKYKSATIEVITSTRELNHFTSQIHEYESNTFIMDKNTKLRVQFAKVHEVRTPAVQYVKPYVM
jgi:hypothetical protein